MEITQATILNAIIDGILVVSPDGKIVSYNDRFLELWQIPADVVAQKSDDRALKFVADQLMNPTEYFERVSYLYAHQLEKSFEEIKLKDGRVFDRYSAPLADELGSHIGRIWVFRDVSHQKQVEEALVSQQKMMARAARMSALGEMAGGIAHEINNPLGIIHAHAEMLNDLTQDQMQYATVKKVAAKIRDTSRRIANIINGLRIISRNGDSDPFEQLVLSSIIEDTLSICVEKFRTTNVEIKFITSDKTIVVDGRATQLMQVFLNLLNNAADATADLDMKWITITLEQTGDKVEACIIDSGTGVDAAIAERIFQPFFTTKAAGQGTGLGLSISKGIIEDHEGKLFLDEHSPNTCFKIILPVHQTKR